MFGDFEAQRHWMEITTNLPIKQWYSYKLEYWGLDYPPLSAYHAYICGKIGGLINITMFQLDKSRGFESSILKLFMRFSSLATDYLVLVPAIFVFKKYKMDLKLLMLLISPGISLIEHGHFQYNSGMLGLALLGFHYIIEDRLVVGSILFCCALMFKQMALFYSLPVFVFILSRLRLKPFPRG